MPIYGSPYPESIKNELDRSTKEHHTSNSHRHLLGILNQPILSDISGIQDAQSYSPKCNIIFEKHTAMTMNELLDLSWKPQTNLQAPRTKIKLLIYKVILKRIPVIDHLSP